MVLDSTGKIVQKRESEKQFEKYLIIIEIYVFSVKNKTKVSCSAFEG